MFLRRRLIAPTLALTALCAWGAEPAPVVDATLADGAQLITHWGQTPWGKTWADPAMKPLRDKFAAWEQEQKTKSGLGATPTELLAAITNAGLTVRPGAEKNKVAVYAAADFAAFAKAIFAAAKKGGPNNSDAGVPGADESFKNSKKEDQEGVFARFASALVVTLNAPSVKPVQRATPPSDDLFVKAQMVPLIDLLIAAIPDPKVEEALAPTRVQMAAMKAQDMTYRMKLLPEGFLERMDFVADPMPGYLPVDLKLLGRLPGNTLMAVGMGYDGAGVWKTQRANLLASWAPNLGLDPKNPDLVEKTLNTKLAEMGLKSTVADFFNGLVGTGVLAFTPGVPFPGITIAVPRSPAIDEILGLGVAQLGATLPAEGSSTILPIPNVPVPVSLALDKTHWLVTSDAVYADQWLDGTPHGWLDSPAAKLAQSKAPAGAYLLGASDTPAVLRLLAGYAGMAMGMAKDLPQDQKQAILQGFTLLAQNSATGYVVGGLKDRTYTLETRSITGVVSLCGFAGAAAAGFNMARRANRHTDPDELVAQAPEAPEAPADHGPLTTLRTVIHPAEVQFQGGAYIDQDGDGTGEFGLLSEISGRRVAGTNKVELVEGPLAHGATVEGYSYTIYLPGGMNRVADDGKPDARAPVAKNADAQEKQFVAYAWPSKGKEGTAYALLADGAVYEAPYTGVPPAWNAVFGGKGWADAPTWKTAEGTPAPAGAQPATVP